MSPARRPFQARARRTWWVVLEAILHMAYSMWVRMAGLEGAGWGALKVLFGKGDKPQSMQSFLCLSEKHFCCSCWQVLWDLKPRNNINRFVFLKDNNREARKLNQQIKGRGPLL